jgi:hypothetical protein
MSRHSVVLPACKEKNAVGLTTRASAGIKILGVAASLGALAPFVALAILLERDLRKRTARMAVLAAAALRPMIRAIGDEFDNWHEEVTWGELMWQWMVGTKR